MPLFFGLLGSFNFCIFGGLVIAFHFTGVEPLTALSGRAFGLIVVKGLVDNVISDYLWARAVLLTSPTVSTVGLSLTVPLAMLSDLLIHGVSARSPPPRTHALSPSFFRTHTHSLTHTPCCTYMPPLSPLPRACPRRSQRWAPSSSSPALSASTRATPRPQSPCATCAFAATQTERRGATTRGKGVPSAPLPPTTGTRSTRRRGGPAADGPLCTHCLHNESRFPGSCGDGVERCSLCSLTVRRAVMQRTHGLIARSGVWARVRRRAPRISHWSTRGMCAEAQPGAIADRLKDEGTYQAQYLISNVRRAVCRRNSGILPIFAPMLTGKRAGSTTARCRRRSRSRNSTRRSSPPQTACPWPARRSGTRIRLLLAPITTWA